MKDSERERELGRGGGGGSTREIGGHMTGSHDKQEHGQRIIKTFFALLATNKLIGK